jgi:hypothetical protein
MTSLHMKMLTLMKADPERFAIGRVRDSSATRFPKPAEQIEIPFGQWVRSKCSGIRGVCNQDGQMLVEPNTGGGFDVELREGMEGIYIKRLPYHFGPWELVYFFGANGFFFEGAYLRVVLGELTILKSPLRPDVQEALEACFMAGEPEAAKRLLNG